ncbi:GxxExxY protein [Candidatus Parcubacteria bacterium]|nr:GxxExxY protein [Candidatus Parcubacteria bacterium]
MNINKTSKLLYEQESYLIRGACFDVYKAFGGAFKEKIVDRSLTKALEKRGLKIEDQKRINIYFEGEQVGCYIPDKIVNGIVILEIKAKSFLTKQDIDQFWKYLKGSEYKLGFLINFSPNQLEIKRVVYDTARIRGKSA